LCIYELFIPLTQSSLTLLPIQVEVVIPITGANFVSFIVLPFNVKLLNLFHTIRGRTRFLTITQNCT